ncbi:hypothetical protein [Sulfuriferula nivalis]|uniref:Uncharacterized protein n=1 Tax=Sulfuriferula nivalis TaxID=2675298 RepID=A0A809RGM5_9PROT|nr:hypothetical protein [Sulfuriferula nivalis]BBP00024.1 hypothetical protein SFSGTM_07320 [Sulfuriferula nivalis]
MTALTPQPFPADGYRRLSAKETMQRALAMNSTMATDTQPKCSGQVHVINLRHVYLTTSGFL